jgi:hypothetical protein
MGLSMGLTNGLAVGGGGKAIDIPLSFVHPVLNETHPVLVLHGKVLGMGIGNGCCGYFSGAEMVDVYIIVLRLSR